MLRVFVAVIVILEVMLLLNLVVFVIASPDHEGRMRAQLADVLAGFDLDLRQEGWVGRVAGAGEAEVLPDHDA